MDRKHIYISMLTMPFVKHNNQDINKAPPADFDNTSDLIEA